MECAGKGATSVGITPLSILPRLFWRRIELALMRWNRILCMHAPPDTKKDWETTSGPFTVSSQKFFQLGALFHQHLPHYWHLPPVKCLKLAVICCFSEPSSKMLENFGLGDFRYHAKRFIVTHSSFFFQWHARKEFPKKPLRPYNYRSLWVPCSRKSFSVGQYCIGFERVWVRGFRRSSVEKS